MIGAPVEEVEIRSVQTNHTVYDTFLRKWNNSTDLIILKEPVQFHHESVDFAYLQANLIKQNEPKVKSRIDAGVPDLRPHVCKLSRSIVIKGDEH